MNNFIVESISSDLHISGVKCFNLALSLDCGQAFRWEEQSDGSFSGVAFGKHLNILQKGELLIFKNTSKEDFESLWLHYFALDTDYEEICKRISQDSYIAPAVEKFYGIRVLNQEPWETLVSFVISQQNNIKRIKLIINRLCTRYGVCIDGENYTFPDANTLSKLSVSDFEELGTGYRAKYLDRLAKGVASGEISLEKIKALSLEEARKELLKIYGVGEKVANCALLFGFEFYGAFPVDVWMKRVMKNYPNGLPECFSGVEGIAQQYLFHYQRTDVKE